ncbi:MAG TPA: hypothetical protein VFV29_01255, partial [Actinomycetota bacterium]|nr:hypothetical protein [Actinomycetota bacterium]
GRCRQAPDRRDLAHRRRRGCGPRGARRGPCRDLVGCRYDGATMDDHTQTLADLTKRIASAKEFL